MNSSRTEREFRYRYRSNETKQRLHGGDSYDGMNLQTLIDNVVSKNVKYFLLCIENLQV